MLQLQKTMKNLNFMYFQALHNFKIYEKIINKITKPDESWGSIWSVIRMMWIAIWKRPTRIPESQPSRSSDGLKRIIQMRLRNGVLVKALGEMDKHKTIADLGLEQMLENAEGLPWQFIVQNQWTYKYQYNLIVIY